ncbi:MAG TPA: hypothetical protein VIB47_01770 [Dehalococcoidia bacterium]
MPAKAMSGPIVRNRESPAEFAVSQYVLIAIAGGAFASIGFDLAGGLKAGQHGMTFTMSRTALRNSVRIYLKATGRVVADPPDEEVYELLREADPALAEQAWRLELENPLTDAEVASYTKRVQAFYEDSLGLKRMSPVYRYMNKDRDWGRMFQMSRQVAELLEHLGINGVAPRLHRFDNLMRERKNIQRGLEK